MGRIRRLSVTLALLACMLCATPVFAQDQWPATVWEKQFPKLIDWYVRTSSGVLLVYSGKSLTALDAADGHQLWEMQNIELGGAYDFESRGANILEIPGMPVLLLNRVKQAGAAEEELLGVDLWTGKILWHVPELGDLLQALPLYDSGKVLVIWKSADKFKNVVITTATTAAAISGGYAVPGLFLAMGTVSSGQNYHYHLGLRLLNPVDGSADWSAEFPRSFTPGFTMFRPINRQVFLYGYQMSGELIVGKVDLQTGQRAWDQPEHHSLSLRYLPNIRAEAGRLFVSSTNIAAIDENSGAVVWKTPKLGQLAALDLENASVLVAGEEGAFALDEGTGAVQWRFHTKTKVGIALIFHDQHAIAFCSRSELQVVDSTSGKLLREGRVHLTHDPIAAIHIGSTLLLTISPSETSLFDISTAKQVWSEKSVGWPAPPVAPLTSHTIANTPGLVLPEDFQLQLKQNWEKLVIAAENDAAANLGLQRLRPLVDDPSVQTTPMVALLGDLDPTGGFSLWLVDTASGTKRVIKTFAGTQPDASTSLGRIFMVRSGGSTLDALALPSK